MTLRFMQIFVPESNLEKINQLLQDKDVLGNWKNGVNEDRIVLTLLVPVEETEGVMDRFEEAFGDAEGFHVVLFPIEAALPRQEQEEVTNLEDEVRGKTANGDGLRISREELYAQVSETLGLSRVFLTTTALSAVVAAIGLIRDNVPVVIGAMVLAPLLGPNVAMSLATTLGDMSLLRRALLTNVVGSGLALVLAVLIGLFLPYFLPLHQLSEAVTSRSQIHLLDLGLALAAGAAGAMAYTRGMSGSVIGVMVAVALMPPLVVFGMLLGAGLWYEALNAGLLFVANIICINLSGVMMFLWQGVRPRSWWEAEKASRATRTAGVIWAGLLLLLVGIIYWLPKAP